MKLRTKMILVWGAMTSMSIGCVADLVKSSGDEHVLGYHTGHLGTDLYDGAFERKARRVCGGRDFDVVEKSKTPEALEGAGTLVEHYDFYWTVRCKSHGTQGE